MSPIRKTSLAVAAISTTALTVGVLGVSSNAAGSGHGPRAAAAAPHPETIDRTPRNYDARDLGGAALVRSDRRQVADRSRADKAFYRSLGSQAVVDLDPLTHTVRDLGRLDGFLTGRSTGEVRDIALRYVRTHLGALGLKKGDLRTLRFRQDYADTLGLHHLSWTQSIHGTTVFGNGLEVAVTEHGQVLDVQGSPVSGLARLVAGAPAGTLSAPAARSRAASDVRGRTSRDARVTSSRGGTSARTTWSNSDYAKKVWFLTSAGLRPGWSTYVQTSQGSYQHVVDARTGAVLYRHSTSSDANGDAFVFDNYPGAARGGRPKVVNFFERGWLRRNATFLKGTSVTTFSDVNDDDRIQQSEKTPVPGTARRPQFTLKRFGIAASGLCADWVCTWNPNVPGSWSTNRKADATNAFYLASNFHDYLQRRPIGFTPAAGNFTAAGGDPLRLNTMDGADLDAGLPDPAHVDNANMSTPPDGISPTMQMYLFHIPGLSDDIDTGDHSVPTTGSLDASVLYHEYTHGLSGRLVIDANGNSTLNDIQPRAMGEAWSDYYAIDYLVSHGLLEDTGRSGQLLEARYVSAGAHLVRTMAIDCPVGATTRGCTSGFDPSVQGGYTYGDFPTVVGSPEVHGSGEVWGQTLWDLRTALGHTLADNLITRAMSISAEDPSYLDMRNAILRADLVGFGAKHQSTIWKVFAHRGMGFFAGAVDGADVAPAEDFHLPPVHRPHDGVVAGTVTDPTTGDPVAGAVVQVAGQGDQYTTTTDSDGEYAIFGLVTGTYAKVAASAPGYLGDQHRGTAVRFQLFTDADAIDFSIVRDWASASGGGSVFSFDPPDFSQFGCGPSRAIDTNLGTSWMSAAGVAGEPTGTFSPKSVTIKLPQPVDITAFAVDPGQTCGTGNSSSTRELEIETSTNGVTFTPAADHAFAPDLSDNGRLNQFPPTGASTGVRYVRATILSNQVPAPFAASCPNGGFGGCQFTSLTELAVFGTPTP